MRIAPSPPRKIVSPVSEASKVIDAGVSGVDNCEAFELEPEPNGCAANLGAYGGTESAMTQAEAGHCVCEEGP